MGANIAFLIIELPNIGGAIANLGVLCIRQVWNIKNIFCLLTLSAAAHNPGIYIEIRCVDVNCIRPIISGMIKAVWTSSNFFIFALVTLYVTVAN